MQVIDSSAVVAILQGEPEARVFADAMRRGGCHMSLANVFEAEVVLLGRRGPEGVPRVRILLSAAGTTFHDFDEAQARIAADAYERYGKGRHPARLNLMDCAAYALARSLNAPLLYKGDDFVRTDIASAVTAG